MPKHPVQLHITGGVISEITPTHGPQLGGVLDPGEVPWYQQLLHLLLSVRCAMESLKRWWSHYLKGHWFYARVTLGGKKENLPVPMADELTISQPWRIQKWGPLCRFTYEFYHLLPEGTLGGEEIWFGIFPHPKSWRQGKSWQVELASPKR